MATDLTIADVVKEFTGIGGSKTAGVNARVFINLAANPSDGNRITIYSATQQEDFFFQTTPTDRREVTIETLVSDTVYGLRDKINARKLTLNGTATVYSTGNSMYVELKDTGTLFNVAAAKDGGNIFVSGALGGTDGYNITDGTKTAKRNIALVFKTKGAFAWDYNGYLGRFKFVDGLCLVEIDRQQDWLDIWNLNRMFPVGYVKAYSLSSAEYVDSVSNIRTAVEIA